MAAGEGESFFLWACGHYPTPIHMRAAITVLCLKKRERENEVMKLKGNMRGLLQAGGGTGNGYDKNTLYTCRKFSKSKIDGHTDRYRRHINS